MDELFKDDCQTLALLSLDSEMNNRIMYLFVYVVQEVIERFALPQVLDELACLRFIQVVFRDECTIRDGGLKGNQDRHA